MNIDNIVWHLHVVTKEQRSNQKSQGSCPIWFTNLSGSGKSITVSAIEQKRYERTSHLLDDRRIVRD
tara:strand:- start:27311 stop:27511 length:201 start_codon:yes stop_codon:yes gene_type:complete